MDGTTQVGSSGSKGRRALALAYLIAIAACSDVDGAHHVEPLRQEKEGSAAQGVDHVDLPLVSSPSSQSNEPACDHDGSCCPSGTTPIVGSDEKDIFHTSEPGFCHVALGGDDVIIDTSPSGLHAAFGGEGADVLHGGFGEAILAGGAGADILVGRNSADELYGQGGDDLLTGGGGDDILRGGSGNDTVIAGNGSDDVQGGLGDDKLNDGAGDDVLVGGPGADLVNAGTGNDTVIIHDVCEIEAGEHLIGGSGSDTLIIPIPLADLESLGVTVTGFETVIVAPEPELSECRECGCTFENGAVTCCSDRGTCDLEGVNGLLCDCEPGFGDTDCSYDPAATVFDDPPPVGCPQDGVACSVQLDADDDLFDVDVSQTGQCDDLALLAAIPVVNVIAYYPTPEGEPGVWAPGTFPVVLFNPGNGFDEAVYGGLLAHLARNGMVVVGASPPNNDATSGYRGELLHCLRRLLPDLTVAGEPLGHHITDRLSYLGHSRGGEAVVIATSLDAELSVPRPDAVISLAPTAFCAGGALPPSCGYADPAIAAARGALADGRTRGFLVMEGSRDTDQTGEGNSLYDIAAAEEGPGGGTVVPPPEAMYKAMKWIFDVPHSSWRGDEGTRAALVGRTFGLAFLRWHMIDDQSTRPLFTGVVTDPCVDDPMSCGFEIDPPVISPQYREAGSDLGGRRRVGRYFSVAFTDEEGSGPVTSSGSSVVQTFSEAMGPRRFLRGLSVLLSAADGAPAWVDIRLDGFGAEPVPLNAVEAELGHVSLRLVRVVPPMQGATEAECEAHAAEHMTELSVRVLLEDSEGGSDELFSSAFQRVLPADIAWARLTPLAGSAFGCEIVSFWTTVRIALVQFDGVDPSSLARVRITLDADDHGGLATDALLDSVEIVGNELDPFCGDDVQQDLEVCDGPDLDGKSCLSLGFAGGGVLSCDESCSFDISACDPGGGGGDCEIGDPGCPGGPCLLELADVDRLQAFPGVAAYFAEDNPFDLFGPFCVDPFFICREDEPGVFTCHDCADPADSGWGCPCGEAPGVISESCGEYLAMECVGQVNAGEDPRAAPLAPKAGACFPDGEAPEGYCLENCATQGRVCSKLVDETLPTLCVTPDCFPPCETDGPPGLTVCDRDESECVEPCIIDELCEPDEFCTNWGECWPGTP